MFKFGETVRERRLAMGLSLRTLSKKSGLPVMTISHYENGSLPTLERADALLKALGLTMVLGKEVISHDP